MNDTDRLAQEYAAAGNKIARLERAGKCAHDRTQGFGPVVCRDCGREFAHFEAIGRRLLFGAPISERETRINAAVLSVSRAYDRDGIRGLYAACAAIPNDIAADCHAPIKRAILGR